MEFTDKYWDSRYLNNSTGWDIGHASPPIIDYFARLSNKNVKVLIPGSGKGWEAEHLYKNGFSNIHVLDYAPNAAEIFRKRCSFFPEDNIIVDDFFKHKGEYEIILEQTFFSSLLPSQRSAYVDKVHELLVPGGKLVGLLFNHEFDFGGPPFGGTYKEYSKLFEPKFRMLNMQTSQISIKPRLGREFFIEFEKTNS